MAANAECPATLDAEHTARCVVVEGAGESYQKWLANYQLIGTGLSREESGATQRVTLDDSHNYLAKTGPFMISNH